MNPEIKQRWLTALRSGEYKQGFSRLCLKNSDNEDTYCCLGVLCELAVQDGVVSKTYKRETSEYEYKGSRPSRTLSELSVLPYEVVEWGSLPAPNPEVSPRSLNLIDRILANKRVVSLATLNDKTMLNFAQIADVIEEQL